MIFSKCNSPVIILTAAVYPYNVLTKMVSAHIDHKSGVISATFAAIARPGSVQQPIAQFVIDISRNNSNNSSKTVR
ncbi:hypothetical protein A7K99_10470 [Tatumella citrea]|uniref:Uncharacterized protein n=1 Tax=Tatumella citrea TaxID=53336 RepID=A0A1Y0LL42_TATCI|nr:hypothetical protein A7K98_10470 [Tatumella citrea]ARU98198.1 hypothetical protein A7K99_10470 [Tatumella citrea]